MTYQTIFYFIYDHKKEVQVLRVNYAANFVLTSSISSWEIISGGDITIKFPRTLTIMPRCLHSAQNISPTPGNAIKIIRVYFVQTSGTGRNKNSFFLKKECILTDSTSESSIGTCTRAPLVTMQLLFMCVQMNQKLSLTRPQGLNLAILLCITYMGHK